MKTRKILILGIVAALFVVGVLWYGWGECRTAPIDPVSVSSEVTVQTVDTTRRSVDRKQVRKKKIVQRYDEHGAR